jgi:hypothetical protein
LLSLSPLLRMARGLINQIAFQPAAYLARPRRFRISPSTSDIPFLCPLRKLTAPYLRRMKTDHSVIADPPDKTEVKPYCGLTRKQSALYQTRGPSTSS